MRNWIKWIKK